MNRILAQLSAPAFDRLRRCLEPVDLPPGTRIYEPGSIEHSLYFVSAGVASLLKVTPGGSSAEIAIVGNEGVLGLETFTGSMVAGWRVLVQSALRGFRLDVDALQRELAADRELEHQLLRFAEALMFQIAQTALCYRHHTIEQQFCRWLLGCLDRIGTPQLVMTQAVIASVLGVRREGINAVAGKLQSEGAIRYMHGRIAVLQREALETRACECYPLVNAVYRQLLEGVAV